MPVATRPFVARLERFSSIGSTNDVVRGWLQEGNPEVCVAVADEQTAGRGREGRRWVAPRDAALLLSAGFRPTWLDAGHVWRLAATVSLAMADAAERVSGLPAGTVRLKWPNDLVIEEPGTVRKLGGVLGESEGLGSDDPRVVVGIGVNVDWPATAFPPELEGSMTSLRAATGDQPVDRDELLDAFLERLERGIEALRAGSFDVGVWASRQATTHREVRLETGAGQVEVRAVGVDPESGGLIIAEGPQHERRVVHAGEIVHLRIGQV